MKSLFSSKTFWVATVQALLGAIVIYQGAYPEVGALALGKSVLDIVLRVLTSKSVYVA